LLLAPRNFPRACVIVELNAAAAQAAHEQPPMFSREIAELLMRERLENFHLGRMRDEIFRFDRKLLRNLDRQRIEFFFHCN
jgi:hypothetical protein